MYVTNFTQLWNNRFSRVKESWELGKKKYPRSWLFELETHAKLFETSEKVRQNFLNGFEKQSVYFQEIELSVWHVSVNMISEKELFY